jgi:transcriptional regulator with XRE-family HTH domain
MHPQRVVRLRKHGGLWLKGLREAAGLSQRELANRLEISHYTVISQLENGRGRIPPDRYGAWAGALHVPVDLFVREQLRFYDPITHDILFGSLGASRKDSPAPNAINRWPKHS